MSQSKNEIPVLIAALGITAAVAAGGVWWLRQRFDGGSSGLSAQNQPVPAATESAANLTVPTGRFKYGGSTSWAPIRGATEPLIQQTWPDFELVYESPPSQSPSSAVGIQMLMQGALDFAQSSRPLSDAEKQQAQQQGLSLVEIPVMTEAIAIAVHPDLSLPGLTLAQLKAIYTGDVTNWQAVGGPALSVVPVARSDRGGTVQFFQSAVLGGAAFSPNLQRAATTTAALRQVSSTPGAIYFASAPEVVGQCTVVPLAIGRSEQQLVAPYRQPYIPPADCPTRRNQLDLAAFQNQTYPLTRPLLVVVNANGQPAEQAGRAYAQLLRSPTGQQLLLQLGFVPLSAER
ncbi:MAG: phosphate ABC transporter substrate-binding protein [Leptolyngbya sp. SIO4C1]|nr:phosphate ABC transporter substrate-binding protein [Leptolyngbya sp. SIO4C1]